MIGLHSEIGDRVLDCFAGSGVIAQMATNGVSQAHLIAFAREVALHCVTALAATGETS